MHKPIIKLLIILALAASIFLLIGWEYIRNDIICNAFANQLYSIQLPPNTKIISKDKKLGLLTGNSNHLDFMALIEVESTLTKEELEAYYNGKKVKPANKVSAFFKPNKAYGEFGEYTNYREPININVFSKNKAKMYMSQFYSEAKEIDSQISENLFIIQITDICYPPGRDIRAH